MVKPLEACFSEVKIDSINLLYLSNFCYPRTLVCSNCCWFSLLLKNQYLLIPIRSGRRTRLVILIARENSSRDKMALDREQEPSAKLFRDVT